MATVRSSKLDDLFFDLAKEISLSGKLTKVAQIEDAYESERYGPFAKVPVVSDISKELQVYLAEYSYKWPGSWNNSRNGSRLPIRHFSCSFVGLCRELE